MTIQTTTSTAPTYTTLIDEASGSVTYIGVGKIGSDESQGVWQIRRVQKTSTVTRIQWADGDRRFNNIWDDRASLSYSN